MKRPNITPGPWKQDARLNNSSTLSGADKHLATFHRDGQTTAQIHPSAGEAEANARAIAAVPDTHKALERALGTLERMADKLESYDVGTVEAIRAALTKAGYTF